jgi:hypothetical protein
MFLFIPLTAILRLVSAEVTGMRPWAILMGEESKAESPKPKA